MEKHVSSLKILNIIVCIILLIAFVLVIGPKAKVNAKTIESNNEEVLPSYQYTLGNTYEQLINNPSVVNPSSKEIVYNVDYYMETYQNTIKFFAQLFDFKYDDIIYDLQIKNESIYDININNIGRLKDSNELLINYDSFEYGLIEYFYNLIKTRSIKRHIKYEPYIGGSKYVEKLIIYFSNIYQNTDYVTLLSIGAAESGYYRVKFMLKYNNIFGGMSNKGLIKYNNIELGVLSFVRLMSRNYYGKGLNTLSSIGRIYCPVYEKRIKKASDHWIHLVTNAKNKYSTYDNNISIANLINETVAM